MHSLLSIAFNGIIIVVDGEGNTVKRILWTWAVVVVAGSMLLFGCNDGGDRGSEQNDDDDDTADDDSSWDFGYQPAEEPDVTERGPFEVGNKTVIWVDDSRWDPTTSGPRTLMTEVWYPAAPEAADMPYDIVKNFCPGWWDSYVRPTLEEEYGAPPDELDNFNKPTGSHRDAPPDYLHAPYPMLLFSHGFGGVRIQSFSICEWLASWGFVVVAPDHTGNALLVCLPDGVVELNPDLTLIAYTQRKNDISFLISKLAELSAFDPEEFFTGLIDPTKVGTFGHSFGGTVAVEAAKDDSRIQAAINMASFSFPWCDESFSASTIHMIALEDDTMYDAIFVMRWAYSVFPRPKFKMEFINAGHYTFSDSCILLPSLMGDGDGCGIGERHETGEEFEFIDHDLAMEIISSYAVAFFSYVLNGDDSFIEYLSQNGYPDELEYEFEF